jgi:septal ring factor EnvC (AmiA/AmiB activator)
MSGEKRRYVSVEDQELRRLREQDSRLRSIQRDLPDRLRKVKEESRREFQQQLAPLEKRAKQQEQQVNQLKSGLADLERDTHNRLQRQRQEFQNSIRESEYRQQQA